MPETNTITRLLIGAVAFFFLSACAPKAENTARPPERITIAVSATTDAVLAEVAQVKGFYREEGLEVTPRLHPYGKPALQEVLEGKADFATVAETPVMFAVMNGEKVSIIATIESSSVDNAVIAGKDQGVHSIKDLKGKKIGVTSGTTSEFYLDALLAVNGISRKDVTVMDLKVEKMAEALANGDVDALSTFIPYTILAKEHLGDGGISFQDKNIYTWSFNVVATQDFIRKNPGIVKKLIRALVRAERFVSENPREAQKIVADYSKLDSGTVRDIWPDTRFDVSLDQALILALEDESRWAVRAGLTRAKEVPNYLDFIYFDGLQAVKPEAVRILR